LCDGYAKHEGLFDASMDTEAHRIADGVYVRVARELRAVLDGSALADAVGER
jgi:hypothetical protein